MTNGQNVRMIKCSKSEYDALTVKDDAALYFCKDKKMIFLGSILIASASEWDDLEEPSDVHKITYSSDSDDLGNCTIDIVSDDEFVEFKKGWTMTFNPETDKIVITNPPTTGTLGYDILEREGLGGGTTYFDPFEDPPYEILLNQFSDLSQVTIQFVLS